MVVLVGTYMLQVSRVSKRGGAVLLCTRYQVLPLYRGCTGDAFQSQRLCEQKTTLLVFSAPNGTLWPELVSRTDVVKEQNWYIMFDAFRLSWYNNSCAIVLFHNTRKTDSQPRSPLKYLAGTWYLLL